MLRKNTAGQFLHVAAVNATTGAALTGATISVRRCIDGTFAAAGATVTEDTGLGFYKVALTQADTNGNNLAFFFTATNMIPVQMTVITTACDPTSTAFGLSLAKTTNITGFNDIAATAVVSSGAITTSGGAVSTVTTTTNLTNAPTLGDFTATMKTSIGTAVAASAVASVTGNVGGNVTGSVGSVVGAVGSVTGLTASDVGAIKAKTDSLAFTVAGQVDANVQYVNDVQVTGTGAVGDEWGP